MLSQATIRRLYRYFSLEENKKSTYRYMYIHGNWDTTVAFLF